MRIFKRLKKNNNLSHSIRDYQALVQDRLREYPADRRLALARAIGALTMEDFVAQGDGHVAVLRHHGLMNGMNVYDLGCGCGRTAQALDRSGWQGQYCGADVVPELLEELQQQCHNYRTVLNYTPKIIAPDQSLDLVFHWSVFTHLLPTESFLYTQDAFRALKPNGKMVFSFLELEDSRHDIVWDSNLRRIHQGLSAEQLDMFLHRDWIRRFAREAGYLEPHFTDGFDGTHHPEFWQSLAVLVKPAL